MKEHCNVVWETETQIGSHIPAPGIADGAKQGSGYPIAAEWTTWCESRDAK